ncbi:MAG: ABC transporter permease [Vicinamibacterales bacterium]
MGPRDRLGDELVVDTPGGWRTAASFTAGALLWEVLASGLDASRVPPLSRVVRMAISMIRTGGLLEAVGASLVGLAIGYLAAATAGIAAGLLIGRSRTLERMTDVYIDAVMSAPTLIYVPVLFAAFGVSRVSQVAVVFLYAVFVILETTCAGVRAVDPRLVAMGRAFGATGRQLFTRIVLPAAAPFVLTGLSLGMTRAVKGMVVGEMVIALSGLGAMLRSRGARFDLEGVLALLLVVVIVSTLCTAGVRLLGRRLLPRPAAR